MAVRHDALIVNPVRQTVRVSRPKTETRSLSVEDLKTVRDAVRANGWPRSDPAREPMTWPTSSS
jgi:hypothetical protein